MNSAAVSVMEFVAYFTPITYIVATGLVINTGHISVIQLVTFFSTVTSILISYGLSLFLRMWWDDMDYRSKLDAKGRCRMDFLIGCGVNSILAGIAQASIYWVMDCELLRYHFFFTLNFAIFFIHWQFTLLPCWLPNFTKFEKNSKKCKIIHVLLWGAATWYIVANVADEHRDQTLFYQCYFSVLLGAFSTEYCIAYDDTKGVVTGYRKQNGAHIGLVDGIMKSDPMECGVCLISFLHRDGTPRVLKECGHTICETCVQKLMEKSGGKQIYCPFCRGLTHVHLGTVEGVPKNFTVIEILDNVK